MYTERERERAIDGEEEEGTESSTKLAGVVDFATPSTSGCGGGGSARDAFEPIQLYCQPSRFSLLPNPHLPIPQHTHTHHIHPNQQRPHLNRPFHNIILHLAFVFSIVSSHYKKGR